MTETISSSTMYVLGPRVQRLWSAPMISQVAAHMAASLLSMILSRVSSRCALTQLVRFRHEQDRHRARLAGAPEQAQQLTRFCCAEPRHPRNRRCWKSPYVSTRPSQHAWQAPSLLINWAGLVCSNTIGAFSVPQLPCPLTAEYTPVCRVHLFSTQLYWFCCTFENVIVIAPCVNPREWTKEQSRV
jgi:hypothetical protein